RRAHAEIVRDGDDLVGAQAASAGQQAADGGRVDAQRGGQASLRLARPRQSVADPVEVHNHDIAQSARKSPMPLAHFAVAYTVRCWQYRTMKERNGNRRRRAGAAGEAADAAGP